MQNKLIKIPAPLAVVIAAYYLNREKCFKINTHSVVGEPLQYTVIKSGYTWDKEADLNRVFSMAGRYGYDSQATTGTFWFSRKGYVHKVDETSWPLAQSEKL